MTHIPDGTETLTLVDAALAYAGVGWYVLPIRLDTKHAGSVLGEGWPEKTSRDPETIRRWFTRSDVGLALHVGKSGAVAFDVDTPEDLPHVLRIAIRATNPPFQSGRPDSARGTYVFAAPPGAYGNSNGDLGRTWGDVRGWNGIIVVAPTPHSKATTEGARYLWVRTGWMPTVPDSVAVLLRPPGSSTVGLADDTEVKEFLSELPVSEHVCPQVTKLLGEIVGGRHPEMIRRQTALLRLGDQGHHGVPGAIEELRAVFNAALAGERDGTGEYDAALRGAVAEVRSHPTPDDDKGCCGIIGRNTVPLRGLDEIGDVLAARAEQAAERPEMDVSNESDAADWLRDTVGTGLLAGMFARGGRIVHTPREGEDGYVPPPAGSNELENEDGPAQVQPIGKDQLVARVQYTFRPYKLVKRGDAFVPVATIFPEKAAKVAVNAVDELYHLRSLRGVIHSPVFRADGTLIERPGYDRATGLLHLPTGEPIPPVPEDPTTEEVRAAVRLLMTPIAEFPFVTDHDRANFIGAWLTPLLLRLAPPPYKMIAIEAHQPGSGKTMLANIIRHTHGGAFRSEVPEDSAELRKQITSILAVTTGAVVVLDNVSGVLRSSVLAGLLTSAQWDDRLLGTSNWGQYQNDRLWVATGNNLTLGGDLPRRVIRSTIDPGRPHPEARNGFAIEGPDAWAKDHRGALLNALLTLVRSWVVAGRKLAPAGSSDGYATWVRTVNGILAHCEIPGTFDAPETRVEIGSDDSDWHDFLAAVHSEFGPDAWTAREVLERVNVTGAMNGVGPLKPIPFDALPTELADRIAKSRAGTGGVSKSLGRWLVHRVGRWAGSYCVRSAGSDPHSKVKLWAIETTGEL